MTKESKNAFQVGQLVCSSISIDEIRPYFGFKDKLAHLSKKPNFVQGLQEIEKYILEHPEVKEFEANINFSDDDGFREWLKETKDDDTSDASEEVDLPSVTPKRMKHDKSEKTPSVPRSAAATSTTKTNSSNGVPNSSSKAAAMSLSTQSLTTSPRRGIKMDPRKIGIIGVGTIGSLLAKRLIKAGNVVFLYDKSPKDEQEFHPAQFVQQPLQLLDKCDIIFSCVSDSEAVRDVMFGYNGLGERLGPNISYVELTTIDLSTVTEIHDMIVSRGGRYLEAPMSGTLKDAEEGNLVLMCAGERSLYDELEPCLKMFARRVLYLGKVGCAMKIHLCLQMFNGIVVAGLAETVALAERCGATVQDFGDILELTGMTSCSLVRRTIREIAEGVYMPADYQLGLMQKEIQHAVTLANERLSQPTFFGSTASNVFVLAKSKGEEKSNFAAVYRVFQDGGASKS